MVKEAMGGGKMPRILESEVKSLLVLVSLFESIRFG